MLRVRPVFADRPLTGGWSFLLDALTELIVRWANAALVTATRPPAIAVLACLAALVLSISGLSTASNPPATPLISISLPIQHPSLLSIHAGTLFHTIDSDFLLQSDGTIYVQTGDIPAMWLRDSSAQTLPYVRFATTVTDFQPIVRGVVERNAANVLTNPQANAFTAAYHVWEEKWEPDSLAYPVTLVSAYWNQTHDKAIFTPRLRWALEHTLTTYQCEQHHNACSKYRSRYLSNHGNGAGFSDTGMVWGAFRPSDDRVRYPFNIPQNMLVAVAVEEIAQIEAECYADTALATQASQLAIQVRAGIERYGKVYDFHHGWIYAYEVDGLGNFELMDDANMPNLLSAPYFNYIADNEEVYQNTRRFALSSDDPYYYRGAYASGLGSPHTPTGWVWPLGMISQALTASSAHEVAQLIAYTDATAGSEQLIHESFDPNDPTRFTRPEFGWANALYAELLFRSVAGLPPQRFRLVDRLQPLFAQASTPKITPFFEQLTIQAAIIEQLRRSCSQALTYCYIR